MTVCERTFEASIEDVYAALIEPTTYPHWLVGAKRIRKVQPGWPADGTWFEHAVGFGPMLLVDRTVSLGTDPPHSLSLLVRARPLIQATVTFDLREDDSGCVVTMTESPAGVYRLVSLPAAPILRVRNAGSLARLAAAMERTSLESAEKPASQETPD